jgi:hypothetical protein
MDPSASGLLFGGLVATVGLIGRGWRWVLGRAGIAVDETTRDEEDACCLSTFRRSGGSAAA